MLMPVWEFIVWLIAAFLAGAFPIALFQRDKWNRAWQEGNHYGYDDGFKEGYEIGFENGKELAEEEKKWQKTAGNPPEHAPKG